MANRKGKSGSSDRFYFWGLQNHCGCNCSHEIKRLLLLRRKAMTNRDSVLKNKGIVLLTKVRIVKVMVFPVVVYECESWTVKKAECWRIDAFELWCWRRLLRVPWTARSNQSILKEINPEYSLEGLMPKLKFQYFGHQMERADTLEKTLMPRKMEGRRRRGWQRIRWLDGITDSNMNLNKLWEIVKDAEPGFLQSMGSQRISQDSDWASTKTVITMEQRDDRAGLVGTAGNKGVCEFGF